MNKSVSAVGGVLGEVALGEGREGSGGPHGCHLTASPVSPPFMVNAVVVALTWTVSGVPAGCAAACRRWEASWSRSRRG